MNMKIWILILSIFVFSVCTVGQDLRHKYTKPSTTSLKKDIEPLRKEFVKENLPIEYYNNESASCQKRVFTLSSDSLPFSGSFIDNKSVNSFYPEWLEMNGYDYEVQGIIDFKSANFNSVLTADRLKLSAGTVFSKYRTWGYAGNNVSFNGMLSFRLTDWLEAGLYGTYAPKRYGFSLLYPLIPVSNYGGSIKLHFNDKLGVSVKYGREYNPMKGRWQPRIEIFPY